MKLYGKCSDLCSATIDEYTHDGYAPTIKNVCGGDGISFDVCLDCGQVQGKWPLPPTKLESDAKKAEKEMNKRKEEFEANKQFDPNKFFDNY